MAVVPLPPEFRLERYFALHEFSSRFLLCCSDAEALAMSDVLAMANEKELKLWSDLKLGYTESQGTGIESKTQFLRWCKFESLRIFDQLLSLLYFCLIRNGSFEG